MPEYFYLLLGEPGVGVLADAMKMFKLSVSLRQSRKPFWQKRYHDRNLSSHAALVDALRYVHRNPIKRGLVTEPEDWPWSSYARQYTTGRVGRVCVRVVRVGQGGAEMDG